MAEGVLLDGPTKPDGYVNRGMDASDRYGWGAIMRNLEETPEVRWPAATRAYRLMMNDDQLAATYAMTTWPILNYPAFIDPNGADDAHVRHVSRDMGLAIVGGEDEFKRTATLDFNFRRHLYHGMKCLANGHEYFEIFGTVMADGLWHLNQPRFLPPEHISRFLVNTDGSLETLCQRGSGDMTQMSKLIHGEIQIPGAHLVSYRWDAEDGDWLGSSMLRSLYRAWLVKDVMIRVHAINLERGGGMPYVETEGDMNPQQIEALATVAADWKVSEEGGAALPPGATLHIEKGSAPDAMAFIRYLDEVMARRWLAMFAQLGQTQTGSRALGSTFVDFFAVGQQSIAGEMAEVINNQIIRRLVEYNYGPQELLPRVVFQPPDALGALTDFAAAVNAGIIRVDDELRAWVRKTLSMPAEDPSTAVDPTPKVVQVPGADLSTGQGDEPPAEDMSGETDTKARARRSRSRIAAEGFRRELTAVETDAGLDPTRLLNDHESALDALVGIYRDDIKPALVKDLAAQIEAAGGDPAELAKIQAEPKHADKLKARLKQAWEDGHDSHRAEAKAQGVEIDAGDAEDADAGNRATALGGLLAAGIGVSAMSKAISLTGNGLSAGDVADQVTGFLEGLTDSAASKNIRGAVTRAYNGGRLNAIKTALATKAGTVYASELLDENTCSPCAEIDGHEYDSIDDAEADYPAGPFIGCEGDDNCRGTVVVVYD